MPNRLPFLGLLALIVFGFLGGQAIAANIDDFFGHYRGRTVTEGDGMVSARDLDVTIKPLQSGFQVSWETVVREGDEAREKSYSIDFERTNRPGVFASQMRENMFGQRVPLDPLKKGDPFVWARLHGDTLTVYAMLITESGTYDMQVYERTLVPGGLDLTFTRYQEGEEVRVVRAFLERLPS